MCSLDDLPGYLTHFNIDFEQSDTAFVFRDSITLREIERYPSGRAKAEWLEHVLMVNI